MSIPLLKVPSSIYSNLILDADAFRHSLLQVWLFLRSIVRALNIICYEAAGRIDTRLRDSKVRLCRSRKDSPSLLSRFIRIRQVISLLPWSADRNSYHRFWRRWDPHWPPYPQEVAFPKSVDAWKSRSWRRLFLPIETFLLYERIMAASWEEKFRRLRRQVNRDSRPSVDSARESCSHSSTTASRSHSKNGKREEARRVSDNWNGTNLL